MNKINFEKMDDKNILELSIKSEIEAQKTYETLLERDIPENIKNRLKNFLKSEKSHEESLRNIFNDWYPDEEPTITKESVDIEGQIKEVGDNMKELLEKAMEDEKNAEETYSKLGDKYEDKGKARVFKHLAYTEREHYEAVKRELENLNEHKDSE